MNRRRLLAGSLALALFAAPTAPAALAAPARVTRQAPGYTLRTVATASGPVQELKLKNGMTVLLKENHAAPVVTWVVAYKVGSRNEPAGATGSAHLLEHMMFKGTKTLGKGQVAQLLRRNGASFNATTSYDLTNYFETYGSDRLEMGMKVEAARMRDALILDSERQSEMTVVRNEMERGESSPGSVLYKEIMATAFKSHPYHHPVIGWRSDVEGVATSTLKQYYDTYYRPNNAVAALVGDFKPAEAIALIERYFGAIPAGPTPSPVHTTEEPQMAERRVVLRRRGETNLVQMAFHVPGVASKDVAPLMVMDAVLSSGQTSRLYQALVERQLATSSWSDASILRDAGLFQLQATLKPGTAHADAEQALLAEVEKLKAAPIAEAELAKAKAQSEAGYVYQNEGTEGLAFALTYYGALDRWQRGFELLDEIKAVTAADVQRVAKFYLEENNRTVGWYVATPDGPVPPAPKNAGSGKAVANGAKVVPPPLFDFERRAPQPPRLTTPVKRVLKNGLTVLVLENPSSRTIAVDGFVRAGALLETPEQQGLAGVVAAMLDKGTQKHTKLQLAESLEGVSAGVSFSGGQGSTDIAAHMLAQDADRVFGVLAETLREPSFPEDELAKLKARWIAGIRRNQDDPGSRAARAFTQTVFPPGHPFYDMEPAEQIRQLESLKPEALRAFHARYYGPNTTTLVVVGPVKADDVVRRLEPLFEGWQAAERKDVSIPDVALAPAKRIVIPMMDKTNVEILFGHAGRVKYPSPDYYPTSLANYVLGGSALTSRLGLKLRDEMGLTYGTGSSFGAGIGAGPWKASITVNAANVDLAVRVMREEIARFLKQGVSAQELAFAKSAYIGSQAGSLATNGGMASSLASNEFFGLGLDQWARYPALIQGVSLAQVNAAARRLISPAHANLVIVGPYTDKK